MAAWKVGCPMDAPWLAWKAWTYGTRPRVAMAEGRERIPSEIVSAIMTVIDVVNCECSVSGDGWCRTHSALPVIVSVNKAINTIKM